MTTDLPLTCPMPGCTADLYLTWTVATDLYQSHLGQPPLGPGDAEGTWKVECLDGHVILVPGEPGCGCDDPESPECTHNTDDYDWSDEYRTFTPHDLVRLRELLATMGGAR